MKQVGGLTFKKGDYLFIVNQNDSINIFKKFIKNLSLQLKNNKFIKLKESIDAPTINTLNQFFNLFGYRVDLSNHTAELIIIGNPKKYYKLRKSGLILDKNNWYSIQDICPDCNFKTSFKLTKEEINQIFTNIPEKLIDNLQKLWNSLKVAVNHIRERVADGEYLSQFGEGGVDDYLVSKYTTFEDEREKFEKQINSLFDYFDILNYIPPKLDTSILIQVNRFSTNKLLGFYSYSDVDNSIKKDSKKSKKSSRKHSKKK